MFLGKVRIKKGDHDASVAIKTHHKRSHLSQRWLMIRFLFTIQEEIERTHAWYSLSLCCKVLIFFITVKTTWRWDEGGYCANPKADQWYIVVVVVVAAHHTLLFKIVDIRGFPEAITPSFFCIWETNFNAVKTICVSVYKKVHTGAGDKNLGDFSRGTRPIFCS